MVRVVVECVSPGDALRLIAQAAQDGLKLVSVDENGSTFGEPPELGTEGRVEPRSRRRVTRISHKPKEGERLQDYVLKVLKSAKCPLTYREVGQLVKHEGYRGGMIRKIVSSCSPCLSNLAKQGLVKKIPKPDGSKGFVYELA